MSICATLFSFQLVTCSLFVLSSTSRVGRNNAVDDAIGPTNARHKIVVMGAAKVGKTSIITQFLYNTFTTKYKRTIEEMHQGNFSIAGVNLTLDILDTAGSYEVSVVTPTKSG